jgi:adenine-specific DNA-methyltransferase
MPIKRKTTAKKRPIEQYEHKDKERVNNPQVGLVTPDTDKDEGKKKYSYDPHLDPQLQWAGKAERLSFDVDTVSLHVHERIDPRAIMETVRKKNGSNYEQQSLFGEPEPLKNVIEFYKHRNNWSNRLIAGDSLLVMNSLLEKEGLAGQVQTIYFDPPYGIKYGSNFQPFTNKRNVKDGKDDDLTAEPETIKAFRDTWELGIHSYLSYIRDRLFLARELLSESGSIFVQISDENVHHMREILDEVFGRENFISNISYSTTSGFTSKYLSRAGDYILWYSRDSAKLKYHELFVLKSSPFVDRDSRYNYLELNDGSFRLLQPEEKSGNAKVPANSKIFTVGALDSQGPGPEDTPYEFDGITYRPSSGRHWTCNYPEGLNNLARSKRLIVQGKNLTFKRFFDDFPLQSIYNIWVDIGGSVMSRSDPKIYVVQTGTGAVQRCILMSTDPGDIVLDFTCGSGTTAYVAEQWGRRWITCDTSRVAITLAKQRMMTAVYDYYELAYPEQGVGSGFKYKTVPHITLKSIANNEPPGTETLYDQPFIDKSKARVTGPFTVEAVPSPTVRSVEEVETDNQADRVADGSVARSGETLRQSEWRTELYKTGFRGKGGQNIKFSRVEPLQGTRWLMADAEVKDESEVDGVVSDKKKSGKDRSIVTEGQRVVVSFGPMHAPLEQRQVALALEEAQTLVPKPKMIVFASFQFDPEAAKDIDETNWPGVTLLKVQMNPDMLTDDLKKKRSSDDSFWLIGSPDVMVRKVEGDEKLHVVEVLGFDYFNTKTGNIESGGKDRIAMWLLDTDYDGRSLFPRQVFFPMASEKEGWAKLAKNLKAEIEENLIEAYKGTISLPFPAGEYKRIAIKIVDDRGVESLKVVQLIKNQTE